MSIDGIQPSGFSIPDRLVSFSWRNRKHHPKRISKIIYVSNNLSFQNMEGDRAKYRVSSL
jgi:hypothetical protein